MYRKYVKIRLLSDNKLIKDSILNHNADTKFHKKHVNLIIHIHGGGFVASSSSGHQNYLRKWAKIVPNSLIMSIDYRLAPEYYFPAPLDDVCQAYFWIIEYCRTELSIFLYQI